MLESKAYGRLSHTVAEGLEWWRSGGFRRTYSQVYVELRRMAARYMQRENAGNTLQATALVHELFLKLVDANDVDWKDKRISSRFPPI